MHRSQFAYFCTIHIHLKIYSKCVEFQWCIKFPVLCTHEHQMHFYVKLFHAKPYNISWMKLRTVIIKSNGTILKMWLWCTGLNGTFSKLILNCEMWIVWVSMFWFFVPLHWLFMIHFKMFRFYTTTDRSS